MALSLNQHFQRDIVRGVEGYIVTGSKQSEIGKPVKLEYFSCVNRWYFYL